MSKKELQVVEIATGKVVHRISLPEGASERIIERIEAGMLRNMDRERFCVTQVEDGG